ncbi:FAD-dependent oxidoreductase [Deinococcus humi]|uniref:FAD-dependent oxidoreductase n=1 Tax=Deinococcus humi TaxID=662880 RepID=UPI003CC82E3B
MAVIGTGSGGLIAAHLAASNSQRVLLIERELTGGESTFTGCIPSKTLLSMSRTAHAARQSGALGLTAGLDHRPGRDTLDHQRFQGRGFAGVHRGARRTGGRRSFRVRVAACAGGQAQGPDPHHHGREICASDGF